MFDRFQDKRFVLWSKKVKERDNWICGVCNRYGVPMNSHHINAWDAFIEERYDLNNGVCLCERCHNRLHLVYGKGGNTRAQFNEFKEMMRLINKIVRVKNIK